MHKLNLMELVKNLRGSIVALVTPFNSNGSIDFHAVQRLLDFHIENGTDGLVINGTTGESASLTIQEYQDLIHFVVNHVGKRIPVIVGSGSNSTAKAIQLCQIAERVGADGLLVVSPYYNKPSRKGIYHYFEQVSISTSLPIILYNVPGRTGSNLTADLSLELAHDFENIVGIKEASGDLQQVMEIIMHRPIGFKVYSGDDSLALPIASVGGDGCISVVANQVPKAFRKMLKLAMDGEMAAARNYHFKLLNLMHLNFIESNPIPVKTSLALMGFIGNYFRSPMCPMEEGNIIKLKQELAELCLIEQSAFA